MYYTNKDFEQSFIRYKAEDLPAKKTLQGFYSRNKVPYNLFLKWYRDTRRKVVPVKVSGRPDSQEEESAEVRSSASTVQQEQKKRKNPEQSVLRIAVDIRINNGLQVRQRNLSLTELRTLAENLEVLC